MTSVEEESAGENFSLTDFPDGLPRWIKESVGEFFHQTDFPDILPGRIFLTDRATEMRLGKESRDVMSCTKYAAPNDWKLLKDRFETQ